VCKLLSAEPQTRENTGPPERGKITSHKTTMKSSSAGTTLAPTTSIMQEAMMACINITKPTFELSAQKMTNQKFPMTWLCEMANSVLGENSKLLEYRHLIANPKTRATWTHSYGNELVHLAQGIPGRAKGTDKIFFIPRHKVPRERVKDVTYGLITCLI
jgi:hypothetical protein